MPTTVPTASSPTGAPPRWPRAVTLALADDVDPASPLVRGRMPSAGGRRSVTVRPGGADEVWLESTPARLTDKYGPACRTAAAADLGHALAHVLTGLRRAGGERPRVRIRVHARAHDPAPHIARELAELDGLLVDDALAAAVWEAAVGVGAEQLRARRSAPLPITGVWRVPEPVRRACAPVLAAVPTLVVGELDGPRCGEVLAGASGQEALRGARAALVIACGGVQLTPSQGGQLRTTEVAAGALAAMAGLAAVGPGCAARTVVGVDGLRLPAGAAQPTTGTARGVLAVVLGRPEPDPLRRLP